SNSFSPEMPENTTDGELELSGNQMSLSEQVEFSKVALIADKRRWAFDSIASHISALIARDYSISVDVLYTEDYISPDRLVSRILNENYDVVHWFWRKYLKDLIDHQVAIRSLDYLKTLLQRCAISFSIPEGLFTDADDVFDFSHIFHL